MNKINAITNLHYSAGYYRQAICPLARLVLDLYRIPARALDPAPGLQPAESAACQPINIFSGKFP